MEKGIAVSELLNSSIFEHQFEHEEWPGVHPNNSFKIIPYNGSKFQLKNKYKELFHEIESIGDDLDNDIEGLMLSDGGQKKPETSAMATIGKEKGKGKTESHRKFYKIKYTLNILPAATYEGDQVELLDDLMIAFGDTNDLNVFESKVVVDFFEYQWNSYAKHVHYFGFLVHFIYFVLFVFYVNQIYLDRNYDNRVTLCWMILTTLVYPLIYDGLQLWNSGLTDYFSEGWNYVDQLNIWVGIVNIFVQRNQPDILAKECQILMIMTAMIILLKTFFYMRIFKSFSFMVYMLLTVFGELGSFFLFFLILTGMFGCIFSILDLGNFEFNDDPIIRGI